MADAPRFRIQAVAELTGVPAGTLRAWERRYGVPQPGRADNRYRLYSQSDVDAVMALAQLVQSGLAPAEAAQVVQERLRRGDPPAGGGKVARVGPVHGVAAGPGAGNVYAAAVDDIVAAATDFDQPKVERLVRDVLALGPALDIYRQVFSPVLERLGDQWADGTTGVGEEHLASQVLAGTLRDLVRLVQPVGPRFRLMLACVSGEQHELPLLGVAILAAQSGWGTTVLGAATPPEALEAAIRIQRPGAIGLSATIVRTIAEPYSLFQSYAEACDGLPWIVGGAAAQSCEGAIVASGGVLAEAADDLTPFLRRVDSGHPFLASV